ncbi:MAG: hypothetical protein HY695_37880 [Deltaproteobacteria bacterium]|nr:hypothetical protein [Deltaproteobacteria bacterium]
MELLVCLLNSDSCLAFQEELDQVMGVEAQRFDSGWLEEAWTVRDELLKDLAALFAPRAKVDQLLTKLIDKINDVGPKPLWGLWAGENVEVGVFGKNPAYRIGPDQGVLRIGKEKWIVRMVFDGSVPPKQYLCTVIISALQTGQFNYFKRCQWQECRKFFITSDLKRDAYCGHGCMYAADRKSARERRVWKSGQRKRQEEDRKNNEAEHKAREAERKALEKFSHFLQLAAKHHHTEGELSTLRPILRKVRGWPVVERWLKQAKEKIPLKEIWKELGKEEQGVFGEKGQA